MIKTHDDSSTRITCLAFWLRNSTGMVVHLSKKDTSQGHQIAGRIHGWTKMGLSLALLNLYLVTLATAQGEVNIVLDTIIPY